MDEGARTLECDIVITDIFLKDGSGLGVLRAGSQQSMDMVVISNYATPDMRRKCVELGAKQVFDKSSEIDALIATARTLPLNIRLPQVIGGSEIHRPHGRADLAVAPTSLLAAKLASFRSTDAFPRSPP
jgi:DNA-binding NarL/FixJ family response regulator